MIPLSCVNVNGTDEFFFVCVFTTLVSVPSTESLRTHVSHSHIFGECYTNVRKYEKFINTKFQRTLLRDYVELIVLVALDWKRVPFTPPFHDPHVKSKKLNRFCQMIFSVWS